MASELLTPGSSVWVKNSAGSWVRAIAQQGTGEEVQVSLPDGSQLTVPHSACFLANMDVEEVEVSRGRRSRREQGLQEFRGAAQLAVKRHVPGHASPCESPKEHNYKQKQLRLLPRLGSAARGSAKVRAAVAPHAGAAWQLRSCNWPRSPHHILSSTSAAQDMTTLTHLHEPGVLHNLDVRYGRDNIYTGVGSILIAVNPFKRVPHLFESGMLERYRSHGSASTSSSDSSSSGSKAKSQQRQQDSSLAPHVYGVACSAYHQMLRDSAGQAILVSTSACTCSTGTHAAGEPWHAA